MRKIQIKKWKETDMNGKEVESNTLRALSYCLNIGLDKEKMAGFDKARMISAIDRAFRKAEKSNVLELEETHYMFIKNFVEKYSLPQWGAMKEIMEALTLFMESKTGE